MSILNLFKKSKKPDNYRASENPTKYADTVFSDKATESSSKSNLSPKSLAKTSTSAGSSNKGSIIPGK
jgi:hypothetical protein